MSTGCAAFFDIHGDEVLPYVFIAGSEMLPGFSARQQAEQASVRGGLSRGQYGFPERARLLGQQVPGRRAQARLEIRRPYLRLPVTDPRDAVQGQRQRAGRAQRLERRAQRPARRGHAGPDRDSIWRGLRHDGDRRHQGHAATRARHRSRAHLRVAYRLRPDGQPDGRADVSGPADSVARAVLAVVSAALLRGHASVRRAHVRHHGAGRGDRLHLARRQSTC